MLTYLAERGGFEPPRVLSLPVFETGAFSHSATSPLEDVRRRSSGRHQAPYRISRIAQHSPGCQKPAAQLLREQLPGQRPVSWLKRCAIGLDRLEVGDQLGNHIYDLAPVTLAYQCRSDCPEPASRAVHAEFGAPWQIRTADPRIKAAYFPLRRGSSLAMHPASWRDSASAAFKSASCRSHSCARPGSLGRAPR